MEKPKRKLFCRWPYLNALMIFFPHPAKEAVVKKAEELQAQGMVSVLDKVMALLYYDSVS